MTYKDVCERIVRYHHPEWGQPKVEGEAQGFFEASPSGELWHVWEAWESLPPEVRLVPQSDPQQRP